MNITSDYQWPLRTTDKKVFQRMLLKLNPSGSNIEFFVHFILQNRNVQNEICFSIFLFLLKSKTIQNDRNTMTLYWSLIKPSIQTSPLSFVMIPCLYFYFQASGRVKCYIRVRPLNVDELEREDDTAVEVSADKKEVSNNLICMWGTDVVHIHWIFRGRLCKDFWL